MEEGVRRPPAHLRTRHTLIAKQEVPSLTCPSRVTGVEVWVDPPTLLGQVLAQKEAPAKIRFGTK